MATCFIMAEKKVAEELSKLKKKEGEFWITAMQEKKVNNLYFNNSKSIASHAICRRSPWERQDVRENHIEILLGWNM